MKIVFAITLLALAGALLPGSMLELQRGGSPLAIVTCHFTHFTYEQLAWDAAAFVLLGCACVRRNRGAFHATLLASIVVVPISVLLFAPDIATYRGLSGIDSALFTLLLMIERRNPLVVCCAIAFAMKTLFELTTGAALFAGGDAFVAVPVAHLAGALCGLVIASVAPPVWRRLQSPLRVVGT